MPRPDRSYLLWFSQRVGSTMLAQALEDTGVAGRPREWLEADGAAGLLVKHGVPDAPALREKLWREAATANRVMGAKYGMRAGVHRELTSLFSSLIDAPDRDGRKAWEALFPACRHVFVTRRDKLRIAVSWWRAIVSGEWHRPSRAALTALDGAGRAPPPAPPANLAERYDRDAIAHLLHEAVQREADIQAQLDRWGVIPHIIVYEDLVAGHEATVRALLDFLDIPGRAGITIPAPAFARLADSISDDWCERYRRESAGR